MTYKLNAKLKWTTCSVNDKRETDKNQQYEDPLEDEGSSVLVDIKFLKVQLTYDNYILK